MYGDNRYIDDLRILTAMELYLNSEFYSKHPSFVSMISRGGSRDLEKGGALFDGQHGWPTKKVLGFRWSKKAKITLETKAFGETFLSVFSSFLHFYI